MPDLRSNRRGSIAVVAAVTFVVLIGAVGAALDLMHAYGEQQKLTEVAAMTCQYAVRPSVIQTASANYAGSGSTGTYTSNLQGFAAKALHTQFPQISPSYSATPSIIGTAGQLTTVTFTSSASTSFMRILGVTSVPISATSNCYSTAAVPQVNNNEMLIQETFANALGAGVHMITPSGGLTAANGTAGSIAVHNTFPSTVAFTGTHGVQWYVMGYCLEVDQAGTINASAPASGFSAELDCDNGNGSAGNSSISTQIYLAPGNYELRYFYTGRVDYPDYDPVTLCGSAASDLSWANDNTTGSTWAGTGVAGGIRSNQINVYLDHVSSGGPPPTHTTLDGTQTLAGGNLIDMCVYSPPNGDGLNDAAVWVQRSVRVYIQTAGYYWLSFAADGHSDSFGGQLDDILLCQGTCAGRVQDNFPSASYNPYFPGGTQNTTSATLLPDWKNLALFNDNLQCPAYAESHSGYYYNTAGNLNNDTGKTSGGACSSSASTTPGWPSLTSSGWATAPINQIDFFLAGLGSNGPPTGDAQVIAMAGATAVGGADSRMISRKFLLVPGYYNLSYYYFENYIFSVGVGSSVYCGSTPTSATLPAASFGGSGGNAPGTIRYYGPTSTVPLNINTVGVFLANGLLISTPIGGGGAGSTTSYTNPSGTTTTTPTAAPDAISLTNYTASTTSALLDICGYANTYAHRSINFEIQQTGYYWLTFSSQMMTANTVATGTYVAGGGAGTIDDVVLTALGSPAMTSPPSNPIVVPAYNQGGGTGGSVPFEISYTGFYIVGDPLTTPAPMQ